MFFENTRSIKTMENIKHENIKGKESVGGANNIGNITEQIYRRCCVCKSIKADGLILPE